MRSGGASMIIMVRPLLVRQAHSRLVDKATHLLASTSLNSNKASVTAAWSSILETSSATSLGGGAGGQKLQEAATSLLTLKCLSKTRYSVPSARCLSRRSLPAISAKVRALSSVPSSIPVALATGAVASTKLGAPSWVNSRASVYARLVMVAARYLKRSVVSARATACAAAKWSSTSLSRPALITAR